MPDMITVPVSFGEVLDKITILEIKAERISDPEKLTNIRNELAALSGAWDAFVRQPETVAADRQALKAVNEQLWQIEDEIRDQEANQDFGPRFIELARSVYVTNDRRAAIKRRINAALGSAIVEEKSYRDYSGKSDS